MGTLLYLIVVAISFSMFFIDANKKLCLLIFYTMCLATVNMPSHFMGVYLLPQIFFFFSEISKIKKYYKTSPQILAYILILIIIGTIVLFISSVHLKGVIGFFRIVKFDLITRYLAITYAFLAVKNDNGMKNIVATVSFAVLLLTFFGVVNLLTKHAIFIDWAMQGANLNESTALLGSTYKNATRFRLQSMHWNPFYYGYICALSSIFIVYLKSKRILGNSRFYILLIGCLLGVVFCGSRTVLFCFLTSHIILYCTTHRLTKSAFTIGLLAVVLFISLPYIPFFNEKLRFVSSIFLSESESEVKGSTLEMRETQFLAVLYHIRGHELLGRGYDYFMIDMGWQGGRSQLRDNDLQGLEGIHLSVLLERGIVGMAIYLIFWASLINLFWTYRKVDKETSSMCISVTSCYLMFAFMTGELGTLFFTMLLLSIGISIIYRNKLQNGRYINSNRKL